MVLLRKPIGIEKKKVALQIGRTVLTFSLNHTSINNIPVFKNPMLMEKLYKMQSPKNSQNKSSTKVSTKHKSLERIDGPDEKQDMNGSFLD